MAKTSGRRGRRFRVVVATDGSGPACEAVAAAAHFPWPPHAQATAVIARGVSRIAMASSITLAIDEALNTVARETERALRRRWSNATVTVVDAAPVEGILEAARGAGAVVVGARGHSKLQRWVLGSVSSEVVRQAAVPVLIVKRRPPAFRELLLAYDGSRHAKRAVAFVAALQVPRNGRVTLHTMTEPATLPTTPLLPASIRATLAAEARALAAERAAKARRALERAARPLADAGWRVRYDVRPGVPSRDLTAVPAALRADLLIMGARGASGWKRILLGSVAQAAVDGAPVSLLVVH